MGYEVVQRVGSRHYPHLAGQVHVRQQSTINSCTCCRIARPPCTHDPFSELQTVHIKLHGEWRCETSSVPQGQLLECASGADQEADSNAEPDTGDRVAPCSISNETPKRLTWRHQGSSFHGTSGLHPAVGAHLCHPVGSGCVACSAASEQTWRLHCWLPRTGAIKRRLRLCSDPLACIAVATAEVEAAKHQGAPRAEFHCHTPCCLVAPQNLKLDGAVSSGPRRP